MEINEVPRITCEELKQTIERGEPAVIIDTRKSSVYETGHLKSAVNIYYDPTGYPIEREMILSALPGDTLLVFYCDCMDDSESALMALEAMNLGYDAGKVKALAGGILRWRELGYPVV